MMRTQVGLDVYYYDQTAMDHMEKNVTFLKSAQNVTGKDLFMSRYNPEKKVPM